HRRLDGRGVGRPRVDNGIKGVAFEVRVSVLCQAVADDGCGALWCGRMAAVKYRHIVATPEGLLGSVAADKAGASENEYLHHFYVGYRFLKLRRRLPL